MKSVIFFVLFSVSTMAHASNESATVCLRNEVLSVSLQGSQLLFKGNGKGQKFVADILYVEELSGFDLIDLGEVEGLSNSLHSGVLYTYELQGLTFKVIIATDNKGHSVVFGVESESPYIIGTSENCK